MDPRVAGILSMRARRVLLAAGLSFLSFLSLFLSFFLSLTDGILVTTTGRPDTTRDAKAWVPHEGLMDACQFFRFASATTPAQALGSSEKSGGGDGETTSLVIDTDVTATPDAVAEATRKEEEVEEDENALNDFAIQRMMRGRDALFVGDSQVRHVYAAFLRIAAIGDAHEAHLHPPKRPKLKNSLFNRKYRVYVKSARKTNRNVADEVEEQNIETEVVGDVPGDKHAKTDPLKHRNWTFAIQGGGVAHFVWAPEAKDVVEVVKERLLLDSDGESTKDSKFASPDFLVAGVGLWHMLHQADPNDFQRQVAEVKALLDDIDFKTTVPFWLTVSKPGPSHLMNSVKKQTHLTADSWGLYRQATEKEFSDDASQTLAIDFGALTEKCGAKCSVDGVHVDETAYDAAAQILLNALASLWDVKIPKFRVSSMKGDDASEDSEYEPLDFKEPKDIINPVVARTRENDDDDDEREGRRMTSRATDFSQQTHEQSSTRYSVVARVVPRFLSSIWLSAKPKNAKSHHPFSIFHSSLLRSSFGPKKWSKILPQKGEVFPHKNKIVFPRRRLFDDPLLTRIGRRTTTARRQNTHKDSSLSTTRAYHSISVRATT